jgi:peroxiredoxin Q/BCP
MTPPLKPGDAAPAFSLPDQAGEDVSLAGLAGRKVLVYFYPKVCATSSAKWAPRR